MITIPVLSEKVSWDLLLKHTEANDTRLKEQFLERKQKLD